MPTHFEMIDLSLIRRALDGVDVEKAREHLDRLVLWKPGDLIQFCDKTGNWQDGIVVAWMMHEPSYVCRVGDSRDDRYGEAEKLLGCSKQYVRSRPGA